MISNLDVFCAFSVHVLRLILSFVIIVLKFKDESVAVLMVLILFLRSLMYIYVRAANVFQEDEY